MRKPYLSTIGQTIKFFGLPLLVAIYPAVFHYANNARLVLFSSLLELCVFLTVVSLAIYLLLVILTRGKYVQSAVGAGVILAFFHIYGLVFDVVHSLDILQVETYSFLPLYVFVVLYIVWLVVHLGHRRINQIWSITGLIVAALVLFNVLRVIPIEMDKASTAIIGNKPISSDYPRSDTQYPDIYYLIFDEAAGFEVVRRYWHYDGVDAFVNYLETNDFYVAEYSHSGSTHTLREIATRLNYEVYPIGDEYFGMYNDVVTHNQVMEFLRAHGYSFIAYDERRTAYPTAVPMPVDFLIEKPPEGVGSSNVSVMDEYKLLVLQNTLLRHFISIEPRTRMHMSMILHTTDAITSEQITSPKFVYVHLMLPHVPFAFTETGRILSLQMEYFNWQRYLDNYKFSLRVMREMVENILASANPENPPVIIIQSDHGARNLIERPYTGNLEDYPEDYKTWIINALLLPSCEDAPLSQDMDTINTFPIVFNCYFDANIPLR